MEPFHATVRQLVVISAFPDVDAVHAIPSVEYAKKLLPAAPPATHTVPLNAIELQLPPLPNIVNPVAEFVQFIPS